MASLNSNFVHKVKLSVVSDRSLSYNNCVYLHPDDFSLLELEDMNRIIINDQLVFQCKKDPNLSPANLGTTSLIWKALQYESKQAAIGQTVSIRVWDETETKVAKRVMINVDTFTKIKTCLNHNATLFRKSSIM